MTDDQEQEASDVADLQTTVAGLRAEIQRLEQRLKESNEAARERLIQAQLSAAAVRAGMIDLDGLKLLDTSGAKANEHGELDGPDAMIAELKQRKPWLFRSASSSAGVNPPPAQSPRAKKATEMTLEEYRAARAELLRRR